MWALSLEDVTGHSKRAAGSGWAGRAQPTPARGALMAYPSQPPVDPHQPPYDPSQPPQPYQQQPYPPQGYPPQQPYGYQQLPPPRPVSPRLAFWTSGQGIVCIFLIAGLLVAVLVGVINRIEGPASANFDTTVTSCKADGSTATVGFTIKNVSKKTRSATVKIEYRDGSGNRLDTDTAFVSNIAAGDTVAREESTLLDAAPGTSARCDIVGVS